MALKITHEFLQTIDNLSKDQYNLYVIEKVIPDHYRPTFEKYSKLKQEGYSDKQILARIHKTFDQVICNDMMRLFTCLNYEDKHKDAIIRHGLTQYKCSGTINLELILLFEDKLYKKLECVYDKLDHNTASKIHNKDKNISGIYKQCLSKNVYP